MALNYKSDQLFKGFSKLNRAERLKRLVEMGALSNEDHRSLVENSSLNPELAENFIENVLGYFQIPLGVATNLRIDGKDYVIPMAVEETSIIAAVSKTARWVRDSGRLTTRMVGNTAIGQIQIGKLKRPDHFESILRNNTDYLINLANQEAAHGLCKRGGGVKSLDIRILPRPDAQQMGVIHIHVDTCDAMGANIINQICEFLKGPIEQLTSECVTMCILSNLVDSKLTIAEIKLDDVDPMVGEGIEEACIFAECDPYRAATHNKGVLNGIDPILIATGNDWRAVEAGIHAYASRDGAYRPITKWRFKQGSLHGTFEAPISLGTVGGVTRLHPTSQIALRMLGVKHADELARITGAVGLVQNLGALQALSTVGIIQGHMRLHITNLSLSAGANAKEQPLLQKRLQELLALTNRVTLSNALELLSELRNELASKQDEQTI